LGDQGNVPPSEISGYVTAVSIRKSTHFTFFTKNQ
jgi:hypothetical protein